MSEAKGLVSLKPLLQSRLASQFPGDTLATQLEEATPLAFGMANPEEEGWMLGALGMMLFNSGYKPVQNMQLIQHALNNGVPVYMHDTPKYFPDMTVGGRNIYSTYYIQERFDVNEAGTVILAGQAHYEYEGSNGYRLQRLLGQTNDADRKSVV